MVYQATKFAGTRFIHLVEESHYESEVCNAPTVLRPGLEPGPLELEFSSLTIAHFQKE